jgi:dihydroorotase/N-acyl-D-amino-acid deacylase
MTYLPAQMLGFTDRGIIKNGAMADLVVFNEEKIKDRATFDDPHNYPDGIEYVVVNGKIVFNQDEILPVKPGRVIKNSGKRF